MEFLPFCVLGKAKTKSIKISIQGSVGIGNGLYWSCGCTLDFAFLHAMHYSQKCQWNTSKVFATPKWPIKPLTYHSWTSNSLKELRGTHNRFSLNK
jgi:hypothetical protein